MRTRNTQLRIALVRHVALSLAALLASASASCGGSSAQSQQQQYRVTLEVYSDLNRLPGAQLSVRGRNAGVTGRDGSARLVLAGQDGQVVPVTVRCPTGTRSPATPVDITLRTVQVIDHSAAARGIVHRVNCPPADRTIAVVVRTNASTGLPVMWQGREISRTNALGVAEMTFRAQPGTQLALSLATDSQPTLQPQSPARQILVADADDVYVWDQEFHDGVPTPAPRPHAAHHSSGGAHFIRHIGPIRIRSGN